MRDYETDFFVKKIYLFVQCEAISKDLSADLGIFQNSDAFFRRFLDAYWGDCKKLRKMKISVPKGSYGHYIHPILSAVRVGSYSCQHH